MRTLYLTYALDYGGKLVHIDSVPNGLACKCFCPHCKNELIAKNNGIYKIHHFAHANGSDCAGAIESALHEMAKEILSEHKTIMLPSIHNFKLGKQIIFDKVDVEKYYKDLSLRPDCVGYRHANSVLWIEFKRTHEVDVKKAGKIISSKIDCIEIDLNTCELNPTSVRNFIENDIEKRKWIYNHEIPNQNQLSINSINNSKHNNIIDIHDYEFRQKNTRHFAVDEQNNIVDLYSLHSIDFNEHKYYCTSCGKEVYLSMNDGGQYSFQHLEENLSCNYDFYLHETAKKALCKNFNVQQQFIVNIPQWHICEKQSECKIFSEKNCIARLPVPYDLKANGYDSCEIDYRFPHDHFSYDAIIKNGDDLNKAIIIIINANTYCIDPKSRNNRAIKLAIGCEDDILQLYKNNLNGCNAEYYKFKQKEFKITSWENINRKIVKFTLYSNGRYHFGAESCMNIKKATVFMRW